jgi:NAD(P)-dependent dehydrogenase (short-subunit alcohol dehydrogenase family)
MMTNSQATFDMSKATEFAIPVNTKTYAKKGVTVNAIAPGIIRTALNLDLLDNTPPRGHELLIRTPMGRFGGTEEHVGAAAYLCSDAASFVT